ncbi:tyrosine-type recombinase/integrase [Modestobacter roseus]|uniref:tyrosine-type recombinase/integrase n=1 Tax=Modestobacter roseus TaxID=1181884 RepID=UPI00188615D0|nr:tyrosine-type recombinase/integrase [Modestobacter roseus]
MRAFKFHTTAGDYYSVIDEDYEVVEPAEEYLRYLVFSRGRRPTTAQKYAEGLALYFHYARQRSQDWRTPDMTAFQLWLRVTPSPNERRASRKRAHSGPGATPVRSNARIDDISIYVCEFLKFQVGNGRVSQDVLATIYDGTVSRLPGDVPGYMAAGMRMHRRHTLPRGRSRRRNAPVPLVLAVLDEARHARDIFLLLVLALCGLRRGEAMSLRREDLHFLPDSSSLGCDIGGQHLHVRQRINGNQAAAKGAEDRYVPVPEVLVAAYVAYQRERNDCPAAADCDFVFVNLWRAPLGQPMRLRAANDLLDRLSRQIGQNVSPHMLRHTFASGAAEVATLDVVQKLLGHAWLTSTQVYLHPDTSRLRQAVESADLTRALTEGGPA